MDNFSKSTKDFFEKEAMRTVAAIQIKEIFYLFKDPYVFLNRYKITSHDTMMTKLRFPTDKELKNYDGHASRETFIAKFYSYPFPEFVTFYSIKHNKIIEDIEVDNLEWFMLYSLVQQAGKDKDTVEGLELHLAYMMSFYDSYI